MTFANAPLTDLAEREARGELVLGFYDLTCPFCYVAQGKSALLAELGLAVVELPFQAHPDVPEGGLLVGERTGPMYAAIAEAAATAGLPLRWQPRLPNSRQALAAAEWVRRFDAERVEPYRRSLFAAHFADGENIGDVGVLLARAAAIGIDAARLREALADGSAEQAAARAGQLGRELGVTGTPSWVGRHATLVGNRPVQDFRRFAEAA